MGVGDLRAQWNKLLEKQSVDTIVSQSAVLKQARNIGDSDAYRYESPEGRLFFLKSYHQRPWFIRKTFGCWCLKNEYQKLQALTQEHLARVPEPIDMPSGDVMVCEYVLHGKTLKSSHKYSMEDRPSVDFFKKLLKVMTSLHDHGFAHGDLRRANIMVMDDGTPLLIDFATAIHCRPDSWFGKRWLFSMLAHSDDFSVAKIVRSFYPTELDHELTALCTTPPWYLKIGRFLRQNVYRRFMHRH